MIPLLIAGAAALAGVAHLSANSTNEKAERRAAEAKQLYDSAKKSLEKSKAETESALEKLGLEKWAVLNGSMAQFRVDFAKLKAIDWRESKGLDELVNFSIDEKSMLEIQKMTEIYASALSSGVAGAAAGTVAALAATGSLTLVAQMMGTAGSALVLGEAGIAAGLAGSALSLGAAMTPLAAVAAPIVLFTGISAMMNADDNLDKANEMYAEADAAAAEMGVSETLCKGITERSQMFQRLLHDLNILFINCVKLMAAVIQKKERRGFLGSIFRRKITAADFAPEELRLFAVTGSIAKAIKTIIDTPILMPNGEISSQVDTTYQRVQKQLPAIKHDVETVRSVDYHVKPLAIRALPAASMKNIAPTEERRLIAEPWRGLRHLLMSTLFGIALTAFHDRPLYLFGFMLAIVFIGKNEEGKPYKQMDRVILTIVTLGGFAAAISSIVHSHYLLGGLWVFWGLLAFQLIKDDDDFTTSLASLLFCVLFANLVGMFTSWILG